MGRLERYHANKKTLHWKIPLFLILLGILIIMGIIALQHGGRASVVTGAQTEDLGRKVVVHMPNGQEVYTYEKLIIKKNGKFYYKGDRNTIDLTGGKIQYKNWGED